MRGSHQGPQPERLHLEAGYMAAPVSFRERSDSFPLHRGRRPYMADIVAKVPKYQATIFSKETKLNYARRLIWHPGRSGSRLCVCRRETRSLTYLSENHTSGLEKF